MTVATEARVENLIDEIASRRSKSLSAGASRWPRKNPILSDLADCDRQIVYGITHWEERAMPDEFAIARMDEGKEQEKKIVRHLMDMGFDIILGQKPVEIRGRGGEILATGRIDGMISFEGRKFPFEVKSMNLNTFNQVNRIEDFQRKAWLRKYPRQLQMYLFGNNEEQGIFILTDCLGHWKLIPVFLDYGLCESLLQKLEEAQVHLKSKTLPERISYSEEMCGKCPFAHVCLPDIKNEGLDFIDDDRLLELLKERESLKAASERYSECDTEAKDMARAFGKNFILGEDYSVELRKSTQRRIDTKALPPEVRAKYETETEMVRVNFIPLKPSEIKNE